MNETILTLEHTRQLTPDTVEMVLSGDTSAITAPGQFINVALPGKQLRRPISIANWSEDGLLLLVRIAGEGTVAFCASPKGTQFDVLSGLGNGFDLDDHGKKPVLMGGGVGIAPLYGLAKRMIERGETPTVALGFRSLQDAFYLEEFAALGCNLSIATEDGSLGIKGFVTDMVRDHLPDRDYVYCCGPLPLLRAIDALPQFTGGQFSFEARMGCGFGVCMGCTVHTKHGPKRICKDGPILRKEELVWE